MDASAELDRCRGKSFRVVALMLAVALAVAFGWSVRQTDEFPSASASAAGTVVGHTVPSLHDGGRPLDSYLPPRPLTLETARAALDGPPPEPRATDVAAVPPDPPHLDSGPAFRWLALIVGDGVARTSPRVPTGPPAA